MALTKHQKLAKSMKHLLEALESFYQKTRAVSNVLQFHLYESHLIIGRPLMSNKKLDNLMRTHKYSLGAFSQNENLRVAAKHSPLIGIIFTPRFYPDSRVLKITDDSKGGKIYVPFRVITVLPEENLNKLEESKLEALLYCASENEMSEWIDWYEVEDKASSVTNQMLVIEKEHNQQAVFEHNLMKPAFSFFQAFALKFFPDKKNIPSAILEAKFAPNSQSNLAESYCLVSNSLASHEKRHFEDFQREWRERLIDLLFEEVPIDKTSRDTFLEKYLPTTPLKSKITSKRRWSTGNCIDRNTFGQFIHYFITRFISNSSRHEVDGEIALLLWIMVYSSRDLEKPTTIKKLLALTTEHVSDRLLFIDEEEVEMSCGLANLIRDFAGEKPQQRPQRLFPNLTIDKLEDHFRRASKVLLPPKSLPVLPEAFLTFPHNKTNVRTDPRIRRSQLKDPQRILHDPISLNELKRQLVEKSRANTA